MHRIKTILIEDEPLARKRLEKLTGKIEIVEVVGSFENPIDALKILEVEKVDLIISDIQMPEMDGVTFLKTLAYKPFVIFVTGYAEFATEGFELDVLDYIMKPLLTEERLLKAIAKVNKALLLNKGDSGRALIKIKDRHRTLFLDKVEVSYVNAWGDYVQINTTAGVQTMLCTMKDMVRMLPWEYFVRIQRSYIVNVDEIKSITATTLLLKNGKELPIGSTYRTQLYARMGMS